MTRYLLVALWLFLSPTLLAQGMLTGSLYDAAGGDQYLDQPAQLGVIALPAQAPPFNEITAAQWQAAFTALADPTQPRAALGGLLADVIPTGSWFGEVQGDGTFRMAELPLDTRLGIAARVGELWWPVREEIWFTAATPEQQVRIPYFRLGADPSGIRIARYTVDAVGSVRDDLKYAAISLLESIEFTNTDPAFAAMVRLELDVLVAPGLSARSLPGQYGTQLMYSQGWSALPPIEAAFNDAAAVAWTFGTGGGMHGQRPQYSAGPQASADNWHQLNDEPMLAMVGGGDTEFRVNASPSGRSATLVFHRPVPPAIGGNPGRLVIRLVHKGGVSMASPSDKLSLSRSFAYSLTEASADVWPHLTFAALVEGSHRRLYGQPVEGRMRRFPPNAELEPDLAANETVQIIIGFGPEAQKEMAAIEAGATGITPEAASPEPTKEPAFDVSILFKALALLFGLAFLGALVATVRKPREQQIEKLAELPASREEVLQAVVALEAEYKAGRLPARAYQDHRQRLVNRLVDFDARGK